MFGSVSYNREELPRARVSSSISGLDLLEVSSLDRLLFLLLPLSTLASERARDPAIFGSQASTVGG